MDGVLAQRLFAALLMARTREAAREAIDQTRHTAAPTAHALRAALASVARRTDAGSPLAWPAVEAARAAVAELDATLDRALIAALLREPLAGLSAELDACAHDPERVRHALDAAWRHLAPPGSRAAAALVDLLRAHPRLAPGARAGVYAFLVEHGVDVRGPLADDAALQPAARLAVLSAYAARLADAGRRRPVRWEPDARAALARALSDWTAHATHPRHLFYAFRRHAGLLADRAAFRAAIAPASARWPLAPEVRHELDRALGEAPVELAARALAPGRWECALCGDPRVAVTARRPIDGEDPTQGEELEFACPACDTRYYSIWERATLDHARAPQPIGWSEG